MSYDVNITRLPPFALFDLKGPPQALRNWVPDLPAFPQRSNTLTHSDGTDLCFTGPNRWLLRAPLEQEDQLLATLRPETAPPEISILCVSDTQTYFRITGPDAVEVLSIGCPLDVHPTQFAPEAVSYTEFFGLKALVLRCEGGFEVAVEQSFGDMIDDYFARALA